jgi:hypothetical protein
MYYATKFKYAPGICPVHKAKWMIEMEISIYDSWFDLVVSPLPGLIPDGFFI